ncbi:hypothetical protein UR09_03855 [Candidatus Nitromaritima sp. SCGC AAA799-A02]|nr:hypothetical protein UZ36_06080 [Candidatus Nitromaritima sp. SCGC AAA799-C22]KMP11233.1 hypothetical protein UR09_03855 [Candidatus Nitromaritima sp. SCGC AAA799-A02]
MGSGKSLAAEYFKELGARVIDADRICRLLVEPGQPAWEEIVETFGEEALNPDRTLNRERVADIVFKNDAERNKLESILHPRVIAEEQRMYQEFCRDDPEVLAVIDAALLIESGNHKNVDRVVVVQSRPESQIRRVMERTSVSREEVEKRLKTQLPLEEKLKLADYILENDGSREALKSQVADLYHELTAGR